MVRKGLKSQPVCVSKAFAANHEALLPSLQLLGLAGPAGGARARAGSREASARCEEEALRPYPKEGETRPWADSPTLQQARSGRVSFIHLSGII